MQENKDYTWLQHDINILRRILKDRHITDTYAEVLIKNLLEQFEKSSLPELTVPMVKYAFIYDLGRHEAEAIADYFDQMRRTGGYETELEKYLREKGIRD